MFRASLCPSSGALDGMLLHMVFSTWGAGWCLGTPGSRPCALCRAVFLNCRAAAPYRALASFIPGRERFSWNLSF